MNIPNNDVYKTYLIMMNSISLKNFASGYAVTDFYITLVMF